jgi:hypothetical protein
MSLKEGFAADVIRDGDNVVGVRISAKHSRYHGVYVLGASAPCSIRTPDPVSSFQVTRGQYETDLVAIVHIDRGTNNVLLSGHFLTIHWSAEHPVNLELKQGKLDCLGNRLGQVTRDRLDAVVGDEVYTTASTLDLTRAWKVVNVIPDGGLLCRYLVGQVSAEDLKTAVEKRHEQEDAVLALAELQPKFDKVSKDLEEQSERAARSEKQEEFFYYLLLAWCNRYQFLLEALEQSFLYRFMPHVRRVVGELEGGERDLSARAELHFRKPYDLKKEQGE